MKDYFIFDGQDSRDYGLYVINEDGRKRNIHPRRETTTETIAGRNGSYVFDQVFRDRNVPVLCYIEDGTNNNTRKIMDWLGVKFPRKLQLSYEAYREYKVTFNSQIDISEYVNGGVFLIQFKSYSPFAKSVFTVQDIQAGLNYDEEFYYDANLPYDDDDTLQYSWSGITTTTDMDIYNGSNVDGALPVITINGSASSLDISHYRDAARTDLINTMTFSSFSGELVIDCDVMNIFLDGSVNNTVLDDDGYFELLKNGDNYFRISGSSLSIDVDWEFNFIYL